MECKFIQHGIAIGYDQVVKPCCIWQYDADYKQQNHISAVDLTNWHRSIPILDAKQQLAQGAWPANCIQCKTIESHNRGDSMRGNGNSSYATYNEQDITLEIRPGNTCNFACQSCWPEASSRVVEFHKKANLLDRDIDTNRLDNFDFLFPIRNRIKDVVLLGGEPFYDKSCIKFLAWAKEHLTATLTIFTNASHIDWEFVNNYQGKLVIVVSLDAVGTPAEYIRYGTVWPEVYSNYKRLKQYNNVELRVNVTASVWNYMELESLMSLLCQDWPDLVTFGRPIKSYQNESSVPVQYRNELVDSINRAVELVSRAEIRLDQKQNAMSVLSSIVANLGEDNFSQADYDYLKKFVAGMDRVKDIKVDDYCGFLSKMLS